jgi:uncharacterized protein YbjQ (UPF0145 family)
MVDWDGHGLPPVAADRIARAQNSGVRTSLLPADAAASLQSVGLDAVGEVMGCIVEHVGWQGTIGCGATWGYGSGFGSPPVPAVGSRESRWSGLRPYGDAIRRGYATALSRLMLEAEGLGADGVVGIALTIGDLSGAREFMALGTAVRGRTDARPARPFSTDLPASDVAKLMQAGWVPASLVVAFDAVIKHDDWATTGQARSWTNTEVSGYTELTQHARALVRGDVEHQLARLGADGFVSSLLRSRVSAVEAGENHRDHVAEVLLTGTALAQFGAARPVGRYLRSRTPERTTASLTVLPLKRPTTTRGSRP